MDTHYHLLLQINEPNLPKFMHYLGSSYANYLVSQGWEGHVFSGRYKAILVDREEYMLSLIRYIHLNPVEAAMTARPEEYRWSSYPYYLRHFQHEGNHLAWLKCDWLGAYFHGDQDTVLAEFVNFTQEGIKKSFPYPWENVKAGLILGGDEFVANVLSSIKDSELRMMAEEMLLDHTLSIEEIHMRACQSFCLTDLASGQYLNNQNYRTACDLFLYLAKEYTHASNMDIAEYLGGISCNAISCRYRNLRQRLIQDHQFSRSFHKLANRVCPEIAHTSPDMNAV